MIFFHSFQLNSNKFFSGHFNLRGANPPLVDLEDPFPNTYGTLKHILGKLL